MILASLFPTTASQQQCTAMEVALDWLCTGCKSKQPKQAFSGQQQRCRATVKCSKCTDGCARKPLMQEANPQLQTSPEYVALGTQATRADGQKVCGQCTIADCLEFIHPKTLFSQAALAATARAESVNDKEGVELQPACIFYPVHCFIERDQDDRQVRVVFAGYSKLGEWVTLSSLWKDCSELLREFDYACRTQTPIHITHPLRYGADKLLLDQLCKNKVVALGAAGRKLPPADDESADDKSLIPQLQTTATTSNDTTQSTDCQTPTPAT
eukprot:2039921-Rhodomonas_salina.1